MSAGGGLSASNSSSSSTGPQKSGDITGGSFNFGGINTGNQADSHSQNSMMMIVVVAAVALIGIYFVMRKK